MPFFPLCVACLESIIKKRRSGKKIHNLSLFPLFCSKEESSEFFSLSLSLSLSGSLSMSRYALRAHHGSGGVSGGGSAGRRPSGLGLTIGVGVGGGTVGGNASIDAELAALAALDAGLLPSSLSKEEMRRFATVGISEYLEAR